MNNKSTVSHPGHLRQPRRVWSSKETHPHRWFLFLHRKPHARTSLFRRSPYKLTLTDLWPKKPCSTPLESSLFPPHHSSISLSTPLHPVPFQHSHPTILPPPSLGKSHPSKSPTQAQPCLVWPPLFCTSESRSTCRSDPPSTHPHPPVLIPRLLLPSSPERARSSRACSQISPTGRTCNPSWHSLTSPRITSTI